MQQEAPIIMKLPFHMVVSFPLPMGHEEEAIHGGELGEYCGCVVCCGLAHDKQERASFTFKMNCTDSFPIPH